MGALLVPKRTVGGGFANDCERRESEMSTDFRLSDKVSVRDLFGGQLEKFGVREHVNPETSEGHRILTDGNNYLHVYMADDGFVACLTRFGWNVSGNILGAIIETFDIEIFSEYEPKYWGFETQQEWDAAWEEMADQHRNEWCNKFYVDVYAYVRGEPDHQICLGTIVAKDPSLLQPENKDKLLAGIAACLGQLHNAEASEALDQVMVAVPF